MRQATAIRDEAALASLKREIPAELLSGRRILVTGGARGLGLAFAETAAAAGAQVVIADLLADLALDQANAIAQRHGWCRAVGIDVGDPASIEDGAAASIDWLGGLDGLVNCAAVTSSGGRDAHQLEVGLWDQVMQVNVRGTWLMSRACRAALASSGRGAVVNIASDTALWGSPNLLAYTSSKGAVIAMTRSLAREWGGDSITVNAIAPGLTLVEATEYVPIERHQLYLDGRAIPREQSAADVCGTTLYLLSGLSRFVTGQLVPVNGGFAMH
ncbi:SDR family oxidoreductase [Ramlibacter sp. AW1]|uniref:SDR family oxidoreductase n=1 Tax=Ramlibacter aurantiacus TaxID=2801330 RepID=A0A936ZNQ7_9BURK|nr:SDR family oxidoreductase [Ramlibacter aurantiacus]MBL0420678.1 SDR family oxidoreductase [Ramlibacter aurantiacus]